MRASLSYIQAGLYAGGTFLGIMLACAAVAALAIGGPPTPYETSDLKGATATAMHDMKGAARRMRNGVCRRLPIAMRDMVACPKPAAKPRAAHAEPHAQPVASRHHPVRRNAHRRATY